MTVGTGLRMLLVPLAIYLPGCAACMAWGRSLRRRMDFSETLFTHVLISVIITSFVGLLLAEIGCLTLLSCLVALALVCAVLGLVGRKRARFGEETEDGARWLPWPKPRASWISLAFVLIVLLAGRIYFRPAETFLVLDDAGVYVLSGIHLAETGQLLASDPILTGFTPSLGAELLFSSPWTMCWRRFWGPFYLLNWGRPSVAFGFLDFHRIWVALFVLAFGRVGALYAAPAFGLLSTAGLFFLARRVFDTGEGTRKSTWIGLLGALLLTLNYVQVWNVRYPLSEATTQALIVGGFYLFSLLMSYPSPLVAVACGLCFGNLLLTRLEAVPIMLLAYGMLWAWMGHSISKQGVGSGARRWLSTPKGLALLSFGTMSAYATVHNLIYARHYLNFQIDLFFGPGLARLLSLAGAAVFMLGLWLFARPGPIVGLRTSLRERPWVVARALLISSFVLVLAFVLLWRVLWPPFAAQGDPRWSLLYWTPLGLAAAAGGLTLLVSRKTEPHALPFWTVSLAGIVLYVMNPFIEPIQPWATRRLMPTVMPALALFSAYAIVHFPRLRPRLRRAAQVVTVLVLVGLFLKSTTPLTQRTEFQGSLDQLEDLAHHFPQDALVLFNNHNPAWHVCQPLRYLFGLDVFVLQKESPDTEAIRPLLEQSWGAGRPVYLVLSGGALAWHPPDLVMIPDASLSISLPRTKQAIDLLPSGVSTMTFTFDIYRVVPRDSAEGSALSMPTRLEMTAGEYSYARDGLYGPETSPAGTTFRWTDGAGHLVMVAPAGDSLMLRLSVSGGRRPGVEPPALSALVDGDIVGRTELDGSFDFRILEYPLPSGIGERSDGTEINVELQSDTWVPSQTGGADGRALGVMVDWVEVTSADER